MVSQEIFKLWNGRLHYCLGLYLLFFVWLFAFTGVRLDDPRNQRDWALTSIWALAMDAVAVGLILLVLTGFIMWYHARQRRRWGAIVLLLGFLSCGLFCFGLRWF
jgi:hypothetical protein